jgi:hypothetical protein
LNKINNNVDSLDNISKTKFGRTVDDINSMAGLATYDEMKKKIKEKRKTREREQIDNDLPSPTDEYHVIIKSSNKN